jgi:hypothetical protein
MANTILSHDGKFVAAVQALAVGSALPIVAFTVSVTGTTTSEDITVQGLRVVRGVILQVRDTGNNVVTSDVDVTFSGNVITIADGASFNLDATAVTIDVIAWGS